ncbi:MAG: hypothetical protein U0Q22_14535 [Acidimicrobiales bacterium]
MAGGDVRGTVGRGAYPAGTATDGGRSSPVLNDQPCTPPDGAVPTVPAPIWL